MTFPTITFKNTNCAVDHVREELATEKLSTLQKYLTHATDVRCAVEFERMTAKQNGDVYRVEANLWRSGKLFRAEAEEASFEKGIDEVRRTLEQDIERDQDKHQSEFKKGARQIKEMVRGM